MNRVLLVGNGAREHIIAESLVKNEEVSLFVYMGNLNPGIRKVAKKYRLGNLSNNDDILSFAKREKVDWAIIGPENPLAKGLVDDLENAEIKCASPTRDMSRIEWSKSFTRRLMERNSIKAYPDFYIVSKSNGSTIDYSEIGRILQDWNDEVVIKPDYLTGGKGVKVWGEHFTTRTDALGYIDELLSKGNKTVVIEKRLRSKTHFKNSEFTLQVFVSGRSIRTMPLVQDFKRAYDNDSGPNTGSMGSYTCPNHSLPFLSKNDYQSAVDVVRRVVSSIGSYKGVLYGQFILTDEGVNLIELNARFGDPEAMNVLTLLKSDFKEYCESMAYLEPLPNYSNEWEEKATVCVYMTPKGYPISSEENAEISVDNEIIRNNNSRVYFASVSEVSDNRVLTTKSRSLALLACGNSVGEARCAVYKALGGITGDLHYRTDIAQGVVG